MMRTKTLLVLVILILVLKAMTCLNWKDPLQLQASYKLILSEDFDGPATPTDLTSMTIPRPPAPLRTFDGVDVASMLQEQQGLLQKVLEGQKMLQTSHAELQKKVDTLERQISMRDLTPSSSSGDGKRKRIVTCELSVSAIQNGIFPAPTYMKGILLLYMYALLLECCPSSQKTPLVYSMYSHIPVAIPQAYLKHGSLVQPFSLFLCS